MKNISPFCTCTDHSCPLHPVNHDKGCSLCIAKNLKEGEIPSCFFNMVDSAKDHDSFFFEDFAEAVLKKKSDQDRRDKK